MGGAHDEKEGLCKGGAIRLQLTDVALLAFIAANYKVDQAYDYAQAENGEDNHVLDPHKPMPESEELITEHIADAAPYSNREQGGKTVSEDEFCYGHPHDTGNEEELAPKTRQVPAKQDIRNAPCAKSIFQTRKPLRSEQLCKGVAHRDLSTILSPHPVEDEVGQQKARIDGKESRQRLYNILGEQKAAKNESDVLRKGNPTPPRTRSPKRPT